MFTETWFGIGLNFVINGCKDCPLVICDSPRNWCYLSKLSFDIGQQERFSSSRPKSCKLPVQIFSIRVSPHSYSGYSEEELSSRTTQTNREGIDNDWHKLPKEGRLYKAFAEQESKKED